MNIRTIFGQVAALGLAAMLISGYANAVPVMCQELSKNHMNVDSSYVSACLEAGVGNIGNGINDDFLATSAGTGWFDIADATAAQSGTSGTFSLSAALWSTWDNLAIGFKFGTGNKPDEWFVYSLQEGVSSGTWDFVNVHGTGGGVSHAVIYGSGTSTRVPEPTALGLMGLGLLGLAVGRRLTSRPK